MVVGNRHRETAIVVRWSAGKVVLVTMSAGSLSALTLTEKKFRTEWHEIDYPLARALDQFLAHAERRGATQEALKGLTALKERDRMVIAPLF